MRLRWLVPALVLVTACASDTRPRPRPAAIFASSEATVHGLDASARTLSIHHINVGWGNSVFIVGPDGTTVLIEGGGSAHGRDTVVPYLQDIGVAPENGFDYTIVGHQHCDHLGGLDEVLGAGYDVRYGNYYNGSAYGKSSPPPRDCVPQWRKAVQKTTARGPHIMRPGDEIALGSGARLICIAVNGKVIGGRKVAVTDENDRSIAVLVQYGGFEWLWASDMGGGNIDTDCTNRHTGSQTDVESAVIEAILPGGDHPLISNGGIDVLAVNHHGSESSTNVNLFNGAAPEVAVIATGAGQGGNWHLPRQDVVENVLLARATDCVTAPAALVLQTEEGAPHGSQTSDAGFCVGNIVIKTNGGTSYAVSADGAVTHGPDERAAAGLPATFPIDN